ncbi:hypothetical protein B0H21DRAFT_803618 [Amylocystis lapponica]|nr:hypothetical protein B0H21DRAFT_803618 [Amylocystis lapponica]
MFRNILLSLFPLLLLVECGSVSQDGACSTLGDGLDTAFKFQSDCDDKTFCSGINGTCQERRCRRDEFPFGYDPRDILPALCPRGTFCPDEGSGCKPLVPAGQACQMNRDEQCAPPPNWQMLASNRNFNGSLCLQSLCTVANASLGQHCIADEVAYPATDYKGQQFSNVVIRDNCEAPRFYCDKNAAVCVPTKVIGAQCAEDRECQTYNCNGKGICAEPPEMPFRVPAWQYAITILSVVGGKLVLAMHSSARLTSSDTAMSTTVVMLVLIHKRIRINRYRTIREYYEEQMSLRRSMAALHAAAAEKYEDEHEFYHQ